MDLSQSFTDALNRTWTVEINVATLKRLAAGGFTFDEFFADVDPSKPEKTISKYQAFLNDDIRFSNVLYLILKPAIEKAGLTQEQFDEGLRGDANVRAIMAFHNSYTDFSHGPRQTFLRGLRMAMEKETRANAIGLKRIEQEAEKLTDAKIEELINQKIGEASLKFASDTAVI